MATRKLDDLAGQNIDNKLLLRTRVVRIASNLELVSIPRQDFQSIED
jgi:hypothetical protein